MFERMNVVTKFLKVWVQLNSFMLTPSSVSEYHCLRIYDRSNKRNEPPRGKTNNVIVPVTAKLICIFVFAYADGWFSHEAAH